MPDEDFGGPERTEEDQARSHHTAELTYRAIGRFIHAFSFLEFMMRVFLASKIEVEGRYANFVITHDFALLCTAVQETFGEAMETEKKDRLKRLISRAREFNDLRVKVVHGRWLPFKEGGTLRHISRQSLKDHTTVEMAEQLERQADLMQDINVQLQDLFYEELSPLKPGDEAG